jgi:hypothetical protein
MYRNKYPYMSQMESQNVETAKDERLYTHLEKETKV